MIVKVPSVPKIPKTIITLYRSFREFNYIYVNIIISLQKSGHFTGALKKSEGRSQKSSDKNMSW